MRGIKYLHYFLKGYSNTFYNEFVSFLKSMNSNSYVESNLTNIFVADGLWYKSKNIDFQPYLFFQFKTSCDIEKISKFLEFARKYKMYIDDYSTKNGHVLVLKVPEELENTYYAYIQGDYSKMFEGIKDKYNVVESITIQGKKKLFREVCVINKNEKYGELIYLRTINDEFKTNLELSDIEDYDGEYDIPPSMSQEVLNSKYFDNDLFKRKC